MKMTRHSVSRVYANVNERLGPSWFDYGEFSMGVGDTTLSSALRLDTLQVQWGQQDHYEIVRKVGRGKYSEVSCLPALAINCDTR